MRLAFCRTCTFPATVASDRVHDAPWGTRTLPSIVPVKVLVQVVPAARTVEAPPTSAGTATIRARTNPLIASLLDRFVARATTSAPATASPRSYRKGEQLLREVSALISREKPVTSAAKIAARR